VNLRNFLNGSKSGCSVPFIASRISNEVLYMLTSEFLRTLSIDSVGTRDSVQR